MNILKSIFKALSHVGFKVGDHPVSSKPFRYKKCLHAFDAGVFNLTRFYRNGLNRYTQKNSRIMFFLQ